jgi:hypothetical protein
MAQDRYENALHVDALRPALHVRVETVYQRLEIKARETTIMQCAFKCVPCGWSTVPRRGAVVSSVTVALSRLLTRKNFTSN